MPRSRCTAPASQASAETALAKALGHQAREARGERGWTQADAAARIGVSAEFYGRIERGEGLPSVATLARIAHVLGTSIQNAIDESNFAVMDRKHGIALSASDASPTLRRLERRLRMASPTTIQITHRLLDELGVASKDEAAQATDVDEETTELGEETTQVRDTARPRRAGRRKRN
jgi:transcriptional regulator with XRE-family HTH domain